MDDETRAAWQRLKKRLDDNANDLAWNAIDDSSELAEELREIDNDVNTIEKLFIL